MKRYLSFVCVVFLSVVVSYSQLNFGITGAVKESAKSFDNMIIEERARQDQENQNEVSTPPTNLEARVLSTTEVKLTWEVQYILSKSEDGFKIEYKTPGGSYSQIGTVGENTVSTEITALNADTTYYFRVRMYKGNADSDYSNEAKTKTIAAQYDPPSNSPSGLTWDGSNIWSCDDGTNKIYKHNMDSTLSVNTTYDAAYSKPVGLTWDDNNLWVAYLSGTICKHNMDGTLSINTEYTVSYILCSMAWDGSNIWSYDTTNGICKHNMDGTLSRANTYSFYPKRAYGLTWDGSTIQSLDHLNPDIYKHNIDSTLSINDTYEFGDPSGSYQGAGLTWDGTHFWSCHDLITGPSEDGIQRRIYKH